MSTYHIDLIAEAGTCLITGKLLAEQTEVVTVEAASVDDARKMVPVFMKMRVRGQMLRMFHNGVELFGNC